MNKKKALTLSLFICVIAAGLFWYLKNNETAKVVKSPARLNNENKTTSDSGQKSAKANKREVASISQKTHPRLFSKMTRVKSEIKTNWQKNYQSSLMNNLPDDFRVHIEDLGQWEMKSRRKTRIVNKVLVKIEKPNGMKSEFNALVDSNTGSVIQSFNRTHFEFKKPIRLSHPLATN